MAGAEQSPADEFIINAQSHHLNVSIIDVKTSAPNGAGAFPELKV
jgi:hypothetical protein